MCGHDWCSVRISKEITTFLSGKEESYAWEKPRVSDALSVDQRQILEQRGVLDAGELHRLATKTKNEMGAADGQATCHSEVSDASKARELQREKLDPVSLEPLP